uniref:Uncharacterized protein n=1 Tax=Anopheles albimanus TaxID=7167 RepID=A0A182FVJ5_ANOAL
MSAIIHLLFFREHNRLALQLKLLNPSWSDRTLYEEARRINIAQYQRIVYYELLPKFLGRTNMINNRLIYESSGFVNDYDASQNPASIAEFANVVASFLNSQLPGAINFVVNGTIQSKALSSLYPKLQTLESDFGTFFAAMSTQTARLVDTSFSIEWKNFMYRGNAPLGQDLLAIDLQKMRDFGFAPYNLYLFGVLELRMLVKAMDILDHVLNSKPTVLSSSDPNSATPLQKSPAFAQRLWDVLLEGREEFPDFFQILLGVQLQYYDLSVKDYQTLMPKARMLMQYLQYTGLLQKNYPGIFARASTANDWDMFVASLLLRFAMLTTNRSSTFSYNLTFDEHCKQQMIKTTEHLISSGSSDKSVRKFVVSSLSPLINKLELKSWDERDSIEMKKLLEDAMSEIAKCDVSLNNPPISPEKKLAEQPSFEKVSRDRDSVVDLWNEATLEAAEDSEEKYVILKALRIFAEKYCPDGMLGIVLNIFKQIEDVCREAETIANIWMEYQQLAELVTMRGLLDRSKLDFHNRFAANF